MKNKFLREAFLKQMHQEDIDILINTEDKIFKDKDIKEIYIKLFDNFAQIQNQEDFQAFVNYIEIMISRERFGFTEKSKKNYALQALGVFYFINNIIGSGHSRRPDYLKDIEDAEMVKVFIPSIQYLIERIIINNAYSCLYLNDCVMILMYIEHYVSEFIKQHIDSKSLEKLYMLLSPVQLAELGKYKYILSKMNDNHFLMDDYYNLIGIIMRADVAIICQDKTNIFDYDTFQKIITEIVQKSIESKYLYKSIKNTLKDSLELILDDWMQKFIESQIKVIDDFIVETERKEREAEEERARMAKEGNGKWVTISPTTTSIMYDTVIHEKEFNKLENTVDKMINRTNKKMKIYGGQ